MKHYSLSVKEKKDFRVAAMRLFREMIFADRIIDNNELLYLEAFSRPYHADEKIVAYGDSVLYRFGISTEDVLDSETYSLSEAFCFFKYLREKEIKFFGSEGALAEFYGNREVKDKYKVYLTINFVSAFRVLSNCDGDCDLAEARLCTILNYVLRKEKSFAFSNVNQHFRFSKHELMYFNPNSSESDESFRQEASKISRRLELFGMHFVSLPVIKKELLAKEPTLQQLLNFVYPNLFVKAGDNESEVFKQSRIDLVINAIGQISDTLFLSHVFGDKSVTKLKSPFVLIKVGRSTINIGGKKARTDTVDDFVCIPLDDSIAKFCDEFTDDVLVIAQSIDSSIQLNADKPIVIKGFVKTILDYAVFLASYEIEEIIIDTANSAISFGGIIPDVKIPARSLATYLVIAAVTAINGKGINRYESDASELYNRIGKLFNILSFDLFINIKDRCLDLDTKHVTSNFATPLNENKLIRNVSSLVPQTTFQGNKSYVSIKKDILKLIKVRSKRSKSGLDGGIVRSLNLFIDEFLLPKAELKREDFC